MLPDMATDLNCPITLMQCVCVLLCSLIDGTCQSVCHCQVYSLFEVQWAWISTSPLMR